RSPAHPYTRGLLASMPGGAPGQRLYAIEGSVPSPGDLPPGCAFNPRCPDRFEPCLLAAPPDYQAGPARLAKCYLHDPVATVAPRTSHFAPRASHPAPRTSPPAPRTPHL